LIAVGELTVRGVAVKTPEVSPEAIVTVEGIITSGKDVTNPIDAPALGAAALSCTVHVETAGGVNEDGVHEKPSNAAGCRIVTVPPVAVEASA
jgi:hypothetical protein